MQAQGASDAGRLVSESAYEYLLSEVLAMNPPLRPDLAGHATDEASASAMMVERLDAMGYDVGYRYVEKAVAHQYFIGTEPLDIVKFICKEFWEDIFRKKVCPLLCSSAIGAQYPSSWCATYLQAPPPPYLSDRQTAD